jgi:hypothetical protein
MLRRFVRTPADVSTKRSAFNFSVEQSKKNFKKKRPQFFEISGTVHQSTRFHVPEELKIQQHRCDNLKTRARV